MKTYLLIFSLAFLLLAACAAPGVGEEPTPTAGPVGPEEEAGYTLEWLAGLDPETVLLQQDYEPTFARIEANYPFGRVPSFTLFADGTVIFTDLDETLGVEVVLTARLSPEATLALVTEVMDAGFEGLEDYLDFCMPQPDGTEMCVADASFTVLRATLADGTFREVKSYANFSNDPAALEEILLILDGFTAPDAQTYVPAQAALFYRQLSGALEIPVSPWPLEPGVLIPGSEEIRALVLEGDDLKRVIEGFGRSYGDFNVESGGNTFSVYLVPWLPYTDYAEELAAAFPAIPQPQPEPILKIDEAAREALALLIGVPVEAITVTSVEFVEWPNGCLGIEYKDTACTEVIVPGFRLLLAVEGDEQVYEYRSNQDGTLLLLAEPEELRSTDY